MNRFLAFSFALATAFPLACGDDGGGSATDAGLPIDSGPDVDADTRPTVGTCSIVVAPLPEGGAGGLAPDLSGNIVLFSNPDGSLIQSAVTNSKGEASIELCVRDTLITAIVGMPLAITGGDGPVEPVWYEVATFAGVQVGDVVYWGDNEPPGLPTPVYTNVNVSFDQDESAFAEGFDNIQVTITSSDYHLPEYWDCGEYYGTFAYALDAVATLGLNVGCMQPDGTVDVLARVWKGGEVLAYAFAHDVAVVAGTGNNEPDRGTTAVTLGPWTAGNTDNSLSVANVPAAASSSYASVFQRVDAVSHASESLWMGDVPADSTTFTEGAPAGFANGTEAHAISSFSDVFTEGPPPPPSPGPKRWTEKIVSGPFTDSAEVDMADALPRVAGLAVTIPEPGRPGVHWLLDGSADEANVAVMGLRVTGGIGELIANWTIVTPDAADGFIQAPELSAEALSLLLPSLGVQVQPVFGSLLAMDFQSYGDLITTRGFRPGKFALPFSSEPSWRRWLLVKALPAQMPIGDVSTARRTGYSTAQASSN